MPSKTIRRLEFCSYIYYILKLLGISLLTVCSTTFDTIVENSYARSDDGDPPLCLDANSGTDAAQWVNYGFQFLLYVIYYGRLM